MIVTPLYVPDVLLIEPRVHVDERGLFLQTHHCREYEDHGIFAEFVQDNVSVSRQGVLRGLHFQVGPHAQAKLVTCLSGAMWDCAVDVRLGSPTYGQWVGAVLTDKRQLFVPEGFAHGFVALTPMALVAYKCTAFHHPASERGIRWDDPEIGVPWPVDDPYVSARDRALPTMRELAEALELPDWDGYPVQES